LEDLFVDRNPGNILLHFLFGLLVMAYFLSFFFRVSAAVVLPRLASEMGMTAGMTGFVSSLYYYAYASMQPLCGSLNDRWGPLRVVGAGLVVTSAGAALFMSASTPWTLAAGRLLTGLGLAPMFSGALVYQATAFPAHRYAFYSSVTLAFGNLGAVVSVGPLGAAIDRWGRASVFLALSIASLLLSGLLFMRAKSDPVRLAVHGAHRSVVPFTTHLRAGFSALRASREHRCVATLWGVSVGALLAFQGLWSVAWYQAAYGVEASTARFWAGAVGIGVMAGTLLSGSGSQRPDERMKSLRRGLALNLGAWVALWLGFALRLPLAVSGILGCLLGAATGVLVVHFASALNEMTPRSRTGSVLGVVNMLVMVSVIVFQWGTGAILGRFPGAGPGSYPPLGYLTTFGLAIALVAASSLAFRGMRHFDEAVRRARE
jgi:MFS family permease